VGVVEAQDRPSFSGTWVQDGDTQAGDAAMLKIADSPLGVTIERTVDGQTESVTFSYLEESEAAKMFKGTSHDLDETSTKVLETKAYWHDGHLDTFIARQINGKTVTQNVQYTWDPSLSRMTVETYLQVHHGYEAGGAGATSKLVYVKQ
jgi:hypothetical protein